MTTYYVTPRRRFQKTYGNTYHSVSIQEVTTLQDGKLEYKQLVYIPMQYGYGEQYMQTAKAYLEDNGHDTANIEYARPIDVTRMKDL